MMDTFNGESALCAADGVQVSAPVLGHRSVLVGGGSEALGERGGRSSSGFSPGSNGGAAQAITLLI